MNFYDLEVSKPSGEIIKMSSLKGKIILVVNTATKCGLTPQLEELEKLYQQYKGKGLVILGFPCNQFGKQEPESNESMVEVCKLRHGVTFQLTEKVDVNGKNAHPLFKFLKENLRGFLGKKIRWNFTKFLITADGIPYKRYSPSTKPGKIEKDILKLLSDDFKEPA